MRVSRVARAGLELAAQVCGGAPGAPARSLLRACRLGSFGVVTFVVGCTSMLGIDGDYALRLEQHGAAGRNTDAGPDADTPDAEGSGGRVGTGGRGSGGKASGGAQASGGAGGALGCGADHVVCGVGEKCCMGQSASTPDLFCIAPAPIVGCALDSCTPCPIVPNAIAVCNGDACAIQCNESFVEKDGGCVPQGGGGAGGAGGAGSGTGGKPACVAKNCKNCSLAGPLGCCKSDGSCGCTWAPGAVCY